MIAGSRIAREREREKGWYEKTRSDCRRLLVVVRGDAHATYRTQQE